VEPSTIIAKLDQLPGQDEEILKYEQELPALGDQLFLDPVTSLPMDGI